MPRCAALAGPMLDARLNNGCDMSGGIGAALGEAIEAAEVDEEAALAAVQGALFDLDAEDIGDLNASSPFGRSVVKRRGRPKGSKNIRTVEAVRYFLSQHRHPLDVAMQAYSRTPAEFAASLGMDMGWELIEDWDDERQKVIQRRVRRTEWPNELLVELVKIQLRMVEAVLPYVAQKQPMAVQMEGKAALTVSFQGVSLPARGVAAGETPAIEGEAMHVRLPVKSDDGSRTDD